MIVNNFMFTNYLATICWVHKQNAPQLRSVGPRFEAGECQRLIIEPDPLGGIAWTARRSSPGGRPFPRSRSSEIIDAAGLVGEFKLKRKWIRQMIANNFSFTNWLSLVDPTSTSFSFFSVLIRRRPQSFGFYSPGVCFWSTSHKKLAHWLISQIVRFLKCLKCRKWSSGSAHSIPHQFGLNYLLNNSDAWHSSKRICAT